MPARGGSRGFRRAGSLAVAGALFVSGCSLGGGDGDEPRDAEGQNGGAETELDIEALRAVWAEEVGAACTERNEQIETLAQGLPGVVERERLATAAAQFGPAEDTMLERITAAEPAPGDEGPAGQMASLYHASGELRILALRAKYVKRDRRFYASMKRSEDAREEADVIATELGAESCAGEAPGPYATVDGLAAVRWGDRASKLCRKRDHAFMSFRPTDTARFDAATRRWLGQTRALEPPKQHARKIQRFLDQYSASIQAHKDADAAYLRGDIETGERLTAKGNRLSSKSTNLMYDVGFAIGFERFCSAKPA
jgi:hypothetical protein